MPRGIHSIVLLLLSLCVSCSAAADVYKCTDPEGKTLYSDALCPAEAKEAQNITSLVEECSTPECLAQREQNLADARARLLADQQMLAELDERRSRAELEEQRQQAQLEELRWRAAMEARLNALTEAYAERSNAVVFVRPSHGVHHRHVRPKPIGKIRGPRIWAIDKHAFGETKPVFRRR